MCKLGLVLHAFWLIQFNLTIKTESREFNTEKKNQKKKTDFAQI